MNVKISSNPPRKPAPPMPELHTPRIGGVVPFSACDWPGRFVAVWFVQGCPWRCSYCHNPHLQPRRVQASLDFPQLLRSLEVRRGLLDGVVFSGGEPLTDPALESAIHSVRAAGFAVGLHTGGAYPARLQRLLPLLDWVGLDIKTLPGQYDRLTGRLRSAQAAWRSLALLLAAGTPYEVRTTIAPDWLSPDDLRALGNALRAHGVQHYAWQGARLPDDTAAPSAAADYPGAPLLDWAARQFRHFSWRPA